LNSLYNLGTDLVELELWRGIRKKKKIVYLNKEDSDISGSETCSNNILGF
jgi:hypothetical protein